MDDALARLGVEFSQIEDFCRRWNIVRFELFGSVLRDDFDAESDIDVLVTFRKGASPVRVADHLDMEEEAATLFGRPVDLVKRDLVEESPNWIRKRSILESARQIYATSG
jgi:predicted nucleotidyltransferase